ncbi:tRNA (guanine(37)-N1)-methyltransferase 1 isoform X3 [Dendrobium catenatum]|uniref:tRNA (guanine(37)-N1)-methyltransferase 1 isoform X3 n=1 Tax=Dendrobium catenatum TaxID=906689 RepID=UPI00109EE3AB|nr:tRNA (guanine(37)-N1)-methyltransferase 1 isoform X3 [Dendrobium catenatum]
MASSAFAIRPYAIFFPFSLSPSKTSNSSSYSVKALNLALSSTPDSDHYGPALRRGQRPTPSDAGCYAPECDQSSNFDRSSFSRTFNIAALRIPASDCSTLEDRLRGHLLNWPRIRNIARVPGDDIEPDIRNLLRNAEGDGGQRLVSLAQRAGSISDNKTVAMNPVLYREKLAKEFNCRGFLKFRNLARMSRPKKKKKKNKRAEGEGVRVKDREQKKEYAVVEVTGESEVKEDDMSGLLGADFRSGRWRGSTRLLLLDERLADKALQELPEAVKAVLKGGDLPCKLPVCELIRCQLTLFYNYWHMDEVLETLLPESIVVPTGFETVGHIAHLNLGEEHLPYKKLIAQVVLDKNWPKIQTVVNKIDAIQNDYRTMQLEILAGNHSLVTTVVENGIKFLVDLAKVYWNSRLATERQRLVRSFTSSDVVCDVFSGVGPITISAAKKVKYVYANDLNPHAVEYLERNVILNKLDRKIEIHSVVSSEEELGQIAVTCHEFIYMDFPRL